MADQVIVTYDDDTVTVVSVADQGPPGVSGSSVPATTSTLGGIIVGANLSITGNGVLSANGTSNLPWSNITSKPTFANVATSGLYSDLTGTPNLGVYLTITAASATYALISSLASYLTTANASTTYSVLGHTHTIPNVTGLQTALDGKQVSGSYVLTSNSALTDARTPLAHTQAFSTLTALPATLAAHGITDGLLATTAASTYLPITTAASTYAPLSSPTLTGVPLAPTATAGLSTTQIATTAFVTGGISTLSNTVAATYLTASDANNAFAIKSRSILSGTGLTGGGTLELNRTLSLAVSNVTAGTYGSATVVPVVTVDIYGRITSVSNIAISGGGGGVTSVTGGTGITVTGTTTPSVAIDSTVATLTGTQTLTNKSIAAEQLNSGTLANARLGVSNTTLTYAVSVTWASDYLKVATITLTGACSLTITGLTAGGTYNLIVKQDATGSRIVTWVTTVKWSAGAAPVLSTAANAIDIVSLIYDGTTLFGTALKGFA
jgi:hypothetical protein